MKGNKDTQATIQNVNIKLDPVVKGSAEGVLSGMGLSMSAYVGMCLRQLAQDRKIPFAQTVDPDFWVTEAKVSAAKAHIDSGAFEAAWELFEKVHNEFKKARDNAFVSAFKASGAKSDDPDYAAIVNIANLMGDDHEKSDLGSISKVVTYGKQYPESARRCIPIVEQGAFGRLGAPYLDSFASALEEAADAIADTINATLESEACLREAIGGDPSELDDEKKAEAIDAIIFSVLDVADDHPSNLSMRFVGSGGQATLDLVFAHLKNLNELKEWVSKADERVRERKNDRERLAERQHREFMDLIRANNGTPSVQNVTQVMPQPERTASREELIAQAETYRDVMRILNGGDSSEGTVDDRGEN